MKRTLVAATGMLAAICSRATTAHYQSHRCRRHPPRRRCPQRLRSTVPGPAGDRHVWRAPQGVVAQLTSRPTLVLRVGNCHRPWMDSAVLVKPDGQRWRHGRRRRRRRR